MPADRFTPDTYAAVALGHVTREYPHAVIHVFDAPGPVDSPKALHPIFFGSFDWHSCVHAYWMLAVLLRRFPEMPNAGAIRALFDAQLTPEAVDGERAYLLRPAARGFERPYGWAWLLALQHALDGTPWADTLRPLSTVVAARSRDYLPKAGYPVRVGTHFNSAFALVVSAGYASSQDPALHTMLANRAADWYAGDSICQAWEPGQDEFLSPALVEALCIRRLHPAWFAPWFASFLPDVMKRQPRTLFEPVTPSDRSDGKIAHLDGLNLSRAWCWREIASALSAGDPRIAVARDTAERHLAASLPHVTGDFMGEHWLASFAVLALLEGALD